MTSFWRGFFLFVGAYLLINLTFLTTSPPVWPDETIMADFANNLARSGSLYSSLHGQMYYSLNGLFFYPPLLVYFYSLLIKSFGLSIFIQRLPALLAGLGLLIIFIKLSRFHRYPWLLPLLFLIDFQLMRASRFSRPEIYILTFTFVNIWLLQSKLVIKYALAGFLAVVSCLIHPLGIINLLLTAIVSLSRQKSSILFYLVIFAFGGILLWLYAINWQVEPLLAILHLQAKRRFSEPGFFTYLSQNQPLFFIYYHYGLLILSIFMVFVYSKIALTKTINLFIFLGLIFNWIMVFYGKESWYYVYPVPFLYFLVSYYLNQEKKSWLYFLIIGLLAFIVFCNFQLFRLDWHNNSLSYHAYTQNIIKRLKPNSTVFMSAIPDPYYALKTSSKNFKLFQFPPLPADKQKYYALLNQSDYVVYTGIYDYGFKELLKKYLEQNQDTVSVAGQPGNYQVQLIKLVPKNKRQY